MSLSASEYKITLDSKNRVYRFDFRVCEELEYIFNQIRSLIQDRELDDLIKNLSKYYFSTYKLGNKADSFNEDMCLVQFKKYLQELRGDIFYSDLDADSVICRCLKYDKQRVLRETKQSNADYTQFVNESNCSQICNLCESELVKIFKTSSS